MLSLSLSIYTLMMMYCMYVRNMWCKMQLGIYGNRQFIQLLKIKIEALSSLIG